MTTPTSRIPLILAWFGALLVAAPSARAQGVETASHDHPHPHAHEDDEPAGVPMPKFSLVADFAFAGTDRDDNFENQNQFVLRDVEFGIAGALNDQVSYQAYVHFGEEDIELEEAFVFADHFLPADLVLKAGRFNLDFGVLSRVHDHGLPFVDKPQVLQEYLGGSLRGTGVEVHQDLVLNDETVLHWAGSVVNELDGDAHAIFGPAAGHEHGDEGAEPFGDRDFENQAFGLRVSAKTELGERASLQFGASVAHAPEARAFFESGMTVIAADLETTIFGADVLLEVFDDESGEGWNAGGEFLRSDSEHSDDGVTITDVAADGFYAFVERVAGPRWSYGASGGRFEHAEDDAEDSWDAGAFVTYRINESNRVRVEARHFDDPAEESFGVIVQWTVAFGASSETTALCPHCSW